MPMRSNESKPVRTVQPDDDSKAGKEKREISASAVQKMEERVRRSKSNLKTTFTVTFTEDTETNTHKFKSGKTSGLDRITAEYACMAGGTCSELEKEKKADNKEAATRETATK